MHIERTIIANASPRELVDVLLSDSLMARRARLAGVNDYSHKLVGDEAVSSIVIREDRIPSQARSFLPPAIEVTIAAAARGHKVGYKVTTTKGVPAKITMLVTMEEADLGTIAAGEFPVIGEASGVQTRVSLAIDFQVSIPFVGKKIERAAVPYVNKILAHDCELIGETLSELRAA
ncbi:DUF2505 family protein [Arcanobacterium haemolyticum]|nr:DUF2505 family protein [Arcanobacterium haemolyticum]